MTRAKAAADANDTQPMPPAEGSERFTFAASALEEDTPAAAQSAQPPRSDEGAAAAPLPPPRDEAADAADTAAVVRVFGLLWLLRAARREGTTPQSIAERRSRADSRAMRVGQRVGPRVGRLVGDWLMVLGLAGEVATEMVEDSLDAAAEYQRAQAMERAQQRSAS